jgi:hypothetical protein
MDTLEFIQQAHAPEEGTLCTGFVLVAEWITPEGDKVLSRVRSDYMPDWLMRGMLDDALTSDDWELADKEE